MKHIKVTHEHCENCNDTMEFAFGTCSFCGEASTEHPQATTKSVGKQGETISGSFHIVGDTITFQSAPYIEDGWYVEMEDKENFVLYEIPFGGGEPQRAGTFWDLLSAIKEGINLH